MSRFNKVVILIFLVVLLTTVALLVVSNLLRSKGCLTGVESLSQNYTVKINDGDKWQNFIDAVGNCKNGRFTVYVSGDGGTKLARDVQYVISDERQRHLVTSQDGDLEYTYSFSYDEANQSAKIILHFPDNATTDSNKVGGVFILTSYKLFKGKPMTETDESLKQFFNNIDSLGLTYEKI